MLGAALAGYIALGTIVSCGALPVATPPATRAAQADCLSNRTALQLMCVMVNEAGADIDRCRDDVRRAIDCTRLAPSDGGAE